MVLALQALGCGMKAGVKMGGKDSPHAERLVLKHDHRWLAVIGVPLMLMGVFVMFAIWFLPGVDYQNAWPLILAGQFVPLGLVVLGLHLSFNVDETEADPKTQMITRRRGVSPFQRIRTIHFDSVHAVVVEDVVGVSSSGPQFALALQGPELFLRLWISTDLDAIETEACRWAEFLRVDLQSGRR